MLLENKMTAAVILFAVLIIASVFSLLETAIVAIPEYRLKSLKHKALWIKYAHALKCELDKVLVFSLFGNSLANAAFTTIATIIATQVFEVYNIHNAIALPITTLLIAFFIIVFSEAIPKILAAKRPQITLKIIAIPMYFTYRVSIPAVWIISRLIYSVTRLFTSDTTRTTTLEDIKAMVDDQNSPLKTSHKSIVLNSIELENITIKEVLIPLRMVDGIDISDDIDILQKQIRTTHHTRIIVYQKTFDNIVGYLHTKDIVSLDTEDLDHTAIKKIIRPITFVNDFIPIIRQIHRAQKFKIRIFVVTNEYGDVLGIACLEDMLEIVFGDFTTESPQQKYLVVKTPDNDLIVDGTMLLRELNELYNLHIEAKSDALTVNGLILKTLGGLPNPGVCFKLSNLIFEVLNVGDYWVERVKISILNPSKQI